MVQMYFQVSQEPDLRARHLGDLQGLVLREAAKLSKKAYQAFLSHRTNQEIPVSICLYFRVALHHWRTFWPVKLA